MKLWNLMLILALTAGVLAGCGGDTASPAEASADSAQALTESAGREAYTSAALDTSYEGALPASSQLALGTLELEGTETAVTTEQAQTLLPLWQAIQGGALQSDAETVAVLKQIEGAMTAEQLDAIAALQLTFEDMGTWMREQGVSLAPSGAAGGQSPFGNMTEEERAAMRATAQAGGGFGGQGGPFGNVSEEERAARRATAEASGLTFPGGGAKAGRGQLALLAEQVVELLTQRTAE